MSGRRILLLIALAILGTVGCGTLRGGGLAVSFDVQAPPAEQPEPAGLPPVTEEAQPPVASPIREITPPRQEDPLQKIQSQLRPVYFESNGWEISAEARAVIEANARALLQSSGVRGTVEGHADERGSEQYDYVLGIYRAKAVKDALRSLGVDPARLMILSHGKTRPAAAGSDPESMARNRRVEIVIRSAS